VATGGAPVGVQGEEQRGENAVPLVIHYNVSQRANDNLYDLMVSPLNLSLYKDLLNDSHHSVNCLSSNCSRCD